MSKHTIGGYITTSLTDAKEAHESHGGYLLCIGSTPPEYAVCDREQAIHCWGRTEEQMDDLDQNGFSES